MELLCRLIFDEDDVVSYQALWVCTHFNEDDVTSLIPIQDQMIDVLLVCSHSGKRRLFLSLLFRLPIANPPRVDFLNFCLDHMMSPQETPASQSLCMKLAYNMCRTIPELMQEFCSCLELLEPSLIPLSLRAVKRNAIKAMKSGKALT